MNSKNYIEAFLKLTQGKIVWHQDNSRRYKFKINEKGVLLSSLYEFDIWEETKLLPCEPNINWYEFSEIFVVGDWVYDPYREIVGKVKFLAHDYIEVDFYDDEIRINKDDDYFYELKRPTNGQILKEKERRKWISVGRDVGEYKEGDIVGYVNECWDVIGELKIVSPNGKLGFYPNEDDCIYEDEEGIFLICPVEKRIDMQF